MPNYNEERYIPMPYAISKDDDRLVPFWEIDFEGDCNSDIIITDNNFTQLFSGVWDVIEKKIIPAERKIVKLPTVFNVGDIVFVQKEIGNVGNLDTIKNITYNGNSYFHVENSKIIEQHGSYSDLVVNEVFYPVFHMESGKIVLWEHKLSKLE